MRYCSVIVDLTSEGVDRAFTYSIPDGLTLTPGQRVRAPFGARTLEGFVTALSDEPDCDPTKVKPVVGAIEDYPLILPEIMKTATWMREKYHCTLAGALRLMIPAQLRGGRVREKTVRVARLTLDQEALAQYRLDHPRAAKQLQLLDMLSQGAKPVSALDGATVRALVKNGAVAIDDAETLRSPYAAMDTEACPDPEPTSAQTIAIDQINAAMDAGGGRFLLVGVTGSGKTEVYIHAIRHALAAEKTAIVLVPEIALTPQMVAWFRGRFGNDAAVLHSRLSPGERYDEWRRIRQGDAKIVVGARSAVFAPLKHIGLIVVDEEHENTYRSETMPRYDAREVARFRVEQSGGVLVLGSATPSIASYMRVMPGVRPENRLMLLELNERVFGRPMPSVEIVDMRDELTKGNRSIFSVPLQRALRECLDEGMQAMLFINRRGYSTFVSCRACGYVEKCDACDVSLTYHQVENVLKCHYCGLTRKPPEVCPKCGSGFIKFFGAGTQKVEMAARALFPDARILRMDMDTTRGKDAHATILSAFRRHEADILIGTQMIAKGLDFPNVTVVGVVAADMTINLPDYRSAERTFQLLTQVEGRAGRAGHPGRVIVQTYQPEHFAIQLAARQDYRAFYQEESRARRRGLYPPFTIMARLLVTDKDAQAAEAVATSLEARLRAYLDENALRDQVIQTRALEAPIGRLRGEARWQVFIKLYARKPADAILAYMQELANAEQLGARVELEVNPANMF